jgi:hypothetical protein
MTAVKLSKTLIIIVAVSGLVGCIVILFLISKYCYRPKSAPLPPIQPLAHRRETRFNYFPHPYVPREDMGLDQVGQYWSDASLLKTSRNPSFRSGESSGTPPSGDHSFLVHPPPTNVTYRSGSLSVESYSDEQTSITQQHAPTTRLARSTSRARLNRQRSRANSIASTHSTFTHAHVSTRPVNAIRGAPHSPHSNVQIVLPTPLAPQLRNHMTANLSAIERYGELVERGGIIDRWMTASSRRRSRRLNSDQDLSVRDASRGRKTSSSSWHRDRRPSDTMDRLRRSESQTQSRGRTSSRRSIQPQPPSQGDTTPSPRYLDGQARPPRTTSQNPRDGKGTFMTTSLR